MDSLITAAAQALSAGDPLGALDRIALRNDAPALALRGIAMAQLGEMKRARDLLRRAARTFGPRHRVARARCALAEFEVTLAARDIPSTGRALEAARVVLERCGESDNAAHARHLAIRRHLLLGDLEQAERDLALVEVRSLGPVQRALHELVKAELCVRKIRCQEAKAALKRARGAARTAGVVALEVEVEKANHRLAMPAARLISPRGERSILLDEVEKVLASSALVVDACRRVVQCRGSAINLARRPVLFTLLQVLAEAWPHEAPRDVLVRRAFGLKLTHESHRARLRVEMGRLRRVLAAMASVRAVLHGYRLDCPRGEVVQVLVPPAEGKHGALVALLADGEAWSTSALSLATSQGQRTVQRALESLVREGRVQARGRGRARRWVACPTTEFATPLLLPGRFVAY